MYFVIRLLYKLLILLFLLFAILLRLRWQALHLIELVILIQYFKIHLFDLFHELVEILLDVFHFLYFLPRYRFLARLRR